jgi:RNA 2',3'-cyclic 3'-phosphodiesterase
MHRLFVACRLPAPIRAQLLRLMGGVAGARWQGDEQLHLTLRFIGEVDKHRAEDIASALGRVRHPPVTVTLKGVGHFERKGRIEALWTGVGPRDPLTALHKKVDQAIIQCGLAAEGRTYFPHITLARFGRSGGAIDDFIAANVGLASDPFTLPDFSLFESTLGHDGAQYEMIARYSLD